MSTSTLSSRSAFVIGAALAVWLPQAACTGGIHHRGQHQLSVTGAYGVPFDRTGRGDSAAIGLGYEYFARDRLAVAAAMTPYRNYDQGDGDAHAGELQVGVRWYFWELNLGKVPLAFYVDLLAGLTHSSRSVPEDGACTNFVEDAGIGVQVPITENVSWVAGYRLRHLSHAHVFGGEPNPGQDDQQFYTGLAFSLN